MYKKAKGPSVINGRYDACRGNINMFSFKYKH